MPRQRCVRNMETNKKLSRMSRYELTQLIYDLRRENVALQERCEAAEARVAELERNSSALNEMEERLMTLERIMFDLKDKKDDVAGQKKSEE